MKVSVIIPTYNSWQTLKPCVESVAKQSLRPFEIIVIDNASSDNTFSNLKKLKASTFYYKRLLKIHRLERNMGVTGGRNRGIDVASKKSDYLLFFDHDMVAKEHMIEELCAVAKSKKDAGIVTPKIYFSSDKKRIWSAGTGVNLWTGQVLFRGGKDIGQYEKVGEVQVAPAAMLVSQKTVQKVKHFDERYFATYEDTDFCFRARKYGLKTYYTPRAVAYHKISFKPEDEANRLLGRGYYVGRNKVLFMKDYAKSYVVFLLFLPVYVAYFLYMALTYNDFPGFMKFMKGTYDGIFV